MTHRDPTDLAGRSRKRRALLAGGVVLGLGAVATLAAWSDDVWVVSSFTTTPLSIEAAVDTQGTQWADYGTSPGGKLNFQFVPPAGMLPGETIYAPLNLRVTNGPGARVILETPPSSPTGDSFDEAFFSALNLTLHQIAPASCNKDGATQSSVINGFNAVKLDSQIGEDLLTLPTPNNPQGICFEITLPENVGPEVRGGSTGKLVWTLHADPLE